MEFFTKTHLMLLCYYLVAVFLTKVTADNHTSTTEGYISLQNEILNRPVTKHKIPLDVTGNNVISFSFKPFQVKHVDEIQQSVELSSLIALSWNHSQLDWDPKDYNNQSVLYIDSKKLWVPMVAMPKTDSSPTVGIPDVVKLEPTRLTTEAQMMNVKTSCELDLSTFPFDSHNCSIIFIEVRNYVLKPIENSPHDTSDLLVSRITSEWILQNYFCKSVTREGFSIYTECWFTMKRRSNFYVVSVILPLCITIFLAHFVFVIPAESGQKIPFLVSLLVSNSIFFDFIYNIVPRCMDSTPVIVFVINYVLIHMVVCMLATFLVICRYQAHLERKQTEEENNEKDGRVGRCEKSTNQVTDKSRANSYSHSQRSDAIVSRQCFCPSCNNNNNNNENVVSSFRHDGSVSDGLGRVNRDKDGSGDTNGGLSTSLFKHQCKSTNMFKGVYIWYANLTHSQLDNIFFAFFVGATLVALCVTAVYTR